MNDLAERCPGCMKRKGKATTCPECGFDDSRPSAPVALPCKTLLHKQYWIGRILGKPGGFGITYLAWDTGLDKPVAIKEYFPAAFAGRDPLKLTVYPHFGEHADIFDYGLQAFSKEAKTLARFDHPHIVKPLNVFEENGTAYLVMDYLEGETLDAYLARQAGKRVSAARALDILLPVMQGLEHVHAQGFVHRDIKPLNIYLTRFAHEPYDERPILLDFGAARMSLSGHTPLSVMYTPDYAAPEQQHTRGQGAWTDVYGLAATLYRMTAGVPPQQAGIRLIEDALQDPRELAPELPERFAQALLNGLTLSPKHRPQTVAEFRRLLTAADEPQTSVEPAPEREPAPNPSEDPERTRPPAPRPPPKPEPPSPKTEADKPPTVEIFQALSIAEGEPQTPVEPASAQDPAPNPSEDPERTRPPAPRPPPKPEPPSPQTEADRPPTVEIFQALSIADGEPQTPVEPASAQDPAPNSSKAPERTPPPGPHPPPKPEPSSPKTEADQPSQEKSNGRVLKTVLGLAAAAGTFAAAAIWGPAILDKNRNADSQPEAKAERPQTIAQKQPDAPAKPATPQQESPPAPQETCAYCPEMVKLPGGSFRMGSPESEAGRYSDENLHTVTVGAFSIGQYEVTQGQWKAVMGNNPSRFSGCGDDCPVENVSWNDAQDYIAKLNAKTGQRWRLPTEAEWEYAARGGTDTPFYTGNCISTSQANYDGNYDYGGCGAKTGVYLQKTVRVGSYPANPFGLYDMAGNVWEWTCSAYRDRYDGSEKKCTNYASARRVGRGGSWLSGPVFVRSASRNGGEPAGRSGDVGFRLAQD